MAARIPGYAIAGKTGTAAKLVNGRYSKSDYNGSFVGFVPSRSPAVTIIVVLDSPHGPHGYYGGSVSAPIFRRIAETTLLYLGIGPTIDPTPPILVARRENTQAPPSEPVVRLVEDGPVGTVPDVSGMSAREAVTKLVRLGLDARLVGNGFVASQTPAAGAARTRHGVSSRVEPLAASKPGRGRAWTVAELHQLQRRGTIHVDAVASSDATLAVTGMVYDSRTVEPGQVFVALKGQHADGATFARQALARGASGVVSEQAPPDDVHAPWLRVTDARLALAQMAAELFHHPSAEMRVVGITPGTNGKTTTAYLVASIFEAAGIPCGILGTVGYRVGDDLRAAAHTTPEAPEVQRLLREMADCGCGACAMEVSSHALVFRRVDEVRLRGGVFTNLTRDHLDFHGDMDTVFPAKRRLFDVCPRRARVVNVDDPRGVELVAAVSRPVTFAIGRSADVTSGPLSFSLDGLRFDARTPRGTLAMINAVAHDRDIDPSAGRVCWSR